MNSGSEGPAGSGGRLPAGWDQSRSEALAARCGEYRARLAGRDPAEVARLAAMRIEWRGAGEAVLSGHYWGRGYEVSWPGQVVSGEAPRDLFVQAMWLHYLDRADGTPLSGKWVTLRELGGLFYQQAYQGYTGDELARAWDGRLPELARRCAERGGWTAPGPASLVFEFAALPRVPVCLFYRAPLLPVPARASVLFDASASHYLAVDAAAIIGGGLVRMLLPEV